MSLAKMSAAPHGSRERKILVVGIVVIAAMVSGRYGVPSLRGWSESERALASELIAEAERAERSVRSLQPTLDTLQARRDRLLDYSPALIGGQATSSAGAALAARLSGAAVAAKIQLGTVQLDVDTAASGVFASVVVRGTATGDIRGIGRWLAELEQGPALLALREWSISQSAPEATADQPEALRLEFVVEGLTLNRRQGAGP